MSFNPLISIVIPTYNRPKRLQQCLQSIARSNYPRDRFEVVVVDDGSRKPLQPIIEEFIDRLSIRLIRQKNLGPAGARNTGATAARGHYLAFTDDDCQPHSDWLQALETALNDFPDALIGGHTINALSQNSYSAASQLLIDYIYEYYNQDRGNATFFASNNFAMPRELFHKVGGFDTTFPLAAGEDREFCDRWLHHDFKMHYAPAVQINHFHNLSFRSFWRQHFNYGRGAYCFHQIHGKRNQEGIKVEPVVFYFRLIAYPFKHASSPLRIWLACLLLMSQFANVVGFFRESWLHRGDIRNLNTTA